MKKIIMLLLVILPLALGGWVDPNTINVYSGSALKTDYTYETTNLSGNVQYYLTTYDGICLDSSGRLYNSTGSAINGRVLTSYGEFQCRLPSLSGFQIYQEYVTGDYVRSTWVSYNLTPDELPSTGSGSPFIVLSAVVCILGSAFIAWRCMQ